MPLKPCLVRSLGLRKKTCNVLCARLQERKEEKASYKLHKAHSVQLANSRSLIALSSVKRSISQDVKWVGPWSTSFWGPGCRCKIAWTSSTSGSMQNGPLAAYRLLGPESPAGLGHKQAFDLSSLICLKFDDHSYCYCCCWSSYCQVKSVSLRRLLLNGYLLNFKNTEHFQGSALLIVI